MEDQKTKKINIESIYEDLSVLKLIKYKQQIKRKEFSKNFESIRLMKTDFIQEIDYWDVLMYQIKELSLDFHEERKWKKGICYILSNQIASKLKEKKSRLKLDELYKKCMCLFISMSVNYNFTDISMGKINKKMTKALNDHIKNVTDMEFFIYEFAHWKNKLKDIKNKLEKKYDLNAKKAKNFQKIINLMENMIVMQEEAVKRMNIINQNIEEEKQKKLIEKEDENKKSLESFLMDVDLELSTTQKNETSIETLPNFNELDFLNINKEINNMMNEITDELGNYDIIFNHNTNSNNYPSSNVPANILDLPISGTIGLTTNTHNINRLNSFSSIGTNIINPSFLNKENSNYLNNLKDKSANIPNITNKSLLQISIRNSRYLSPTRSTCENEIIESINPKQLFYDNNFPELNDLTNFSLNNTNIINKNNQKQSKSDEEKIPAEKNNYETIKNYLEKITNSDKVDILMFYNYKKLHKYNFNQNFFYEDYEKTFSSIFKPINYLEENPEDKMFIENNVENLKNKYDKILKEPELLKLFNFKFDKFTILQKLVLLWGLVNYGTRYVNILAEIPNIFSFTRSINYENVEIINFINKILEEYKVDSYTSTFENLSFNNYNNFNNFSNKKNFPSDIKVKKWIYNIDPPMLNNTNWNFFYNKKIFEENLRKKSEKNPLKNYMMCASQEIIENYPIIEIDQNDSGDVKSGIGLIINNPIFTMENKKIIFNLYKDFVKKFCEKVEILYNDTQNRNKKLFLMNSGFQAGNNSIEISVNSLNAMSSNPLHNQSFNNKKNKTLNITNSISTISSSSNITPIKDKAKENSGLFLNKENLLSELSIADDKIDYFSIISLSTEKLNNTKHINKQNMMEGVSFYSQSMIQKEWDVMRSQWYQNNTQFKPKFRKYCKFIF